MDNHPGLERSASGRSGGAGLSSPADELADEEVLALVVEELEPARHALALLGAHTAQIVRQTLLRQRVRRPSGRVKGCAVRQAMHGVQAIGRYTAS
jgi:DNA-binding IscR family transcriptional regulator